MKKEILNDPPVSPVMRRALREWNEAFYRVSGGADSGPELTALPVILTHYLSVLATSELDLRCGSGARAEWLEERLAPLEGILPRAVQLAAAAGQAVIRPKVKGDRFAFEVIPADRFLPLRFGADGEPEEAVILSYVENPRGSFVLAEEYSLKDGVLTLTRRVYRERDGGLGGEVPFGLVEKWADLRPLTVVENCAALPFGVLKMPFANTADDSSPLPVSLYANALENIREFERLYREFLYEFHSGKRKRIVERNAIRPMGIDRRPGSIPVGLSWQDMSTDTYLILDPEEQQKPFDDYSPALRAEEYLTGLKTVLALIENQCFLSPGTLALDDRTGAVTATQVISDDRTTYHTCAAVQRSLKQGLLGLVTACDTLAELYLCPPAGEIRPSVTFGDSVFEDTEKEFDRRLRLVQAGILKKENLLAWYFGTDEAGAAALLPEGGEENG